MIKKSIVFILALLPLCMKAQLGVGSWEVYPVFVNADKMVETPDKIYCLSSGVLMSYDMSNEETYYYGVNNLLSDSSIKNIYYNKSGKYLAVVYQSGGIDLIYDSGKVVNLADIKNAVLTCERIINDVAFCKDRMIVATNFGVVVFDDKKHEVKQSGIYNKNVSKVAATDDYVVIAVPEDGKLYVIENNKRINMLDNYRSVDMPSGVCASLDGFVADKFLYGKGDGDKWAVAPMTYNKDANSITVGDYDVVTSFNGSGVSKNGYYFFNDNTILEYGYTSDFTSSIKTLPEVLQKQTIAIWDDLDKVWTGNEKGIAQFDIANDQISLLNDRIKGESLTCIKVGRLHATKEGRIYVSHNGGSNYASTDWNKNVEAVSKINLIDGDKIYDVSPKGNVPQWNGSKEIRNTQFIIEDPDDRDTYFVCMRYDGIYKVRKNSVTGEYEMVLHYKNTNSKIQTYSGRLVVPIMVMDDDKNIYASCMTSSTDRKSLVRLPAQYTKLDESKKEYWDYIIPDANIQGQVDVALEIVTLKNLNKKIGFVNVWGSDNFGITIFDVETGQFKKFTSGIDQDGKTVDLNQLFYLFKKDKNNDVWIAPNAGGVIKIEKEDFANFLNYDVLPVKNIKVPRNDGTNFADYLLDKEIVNWIDVDAMNRKWIATKTSGAYLVSEDGKQIISHFDKDNSSLPTNTVWAVASDPTSNAVYFGTVLGLVKYNSTASPGAENLSNIYAYPNPVRPEYQGWITVKGLMDNSLVKISDAAGNVLYQGKSQGGMLTWDGCDGSGNRVKTGVYYVFASNGTESATTKILVVK